MRILAAVALTTGIVALLIGILGLMANRRLGQGLRGEPYRQEGDALAAYLPGCSRTLLVLGTFLAAAASALLWLR